VSDKEITNLVIYLQTEKSLEAYEEYKTLIGVFGDNYENMYKYARQHIVDCESCNQFYKEEIMRGVSLTISIKRKLSPDLFPVDDIGPIQDEVKELDSMVLNILGQGN